MMLSRKAYLFVALIGLPTLVGATSVQAAGSIGFKAPTALQGGTGGEPSIGLDPFGHVLVGGPQGVPGGQGAYWLSNNDSATWPATPAKLGGATGGGDEDIAFTPNDGSQYANQIYIADLAATHSTVCTSTDHGATFNAAGPVPDPLHCMGTALGATTPSSDRQWLTADAGGRAYITDHEFVSALPRAWTTANGGADQFVTPCGPIVSDPTILQNVPTDITGGTLVSKPVVDSAGNLYVLFTTTTQSQNLTAFGQGIVSGTFSQAYMAVSHDHCTSFTDHAIYDGQLKGANRVQFGDIFNDLVIDSGGNLYAVAAGFIGTTAFAKTADVFLFKSTDHGVTWSAPYQLTTDIGSHVLPAAAAGPLPGELAIGYYRTTNGKTDPNDPTDRWTYTTALTSNLLDANPTFQFTDMLATPGALDNTYHYGDICTSGTLCGTTVPGTGTDRSLLDFTSAVVDTDGCVLFTFAGNPKSSAAGNAALLTLNYVTKQTSGCFSKVSAVTTTPPVPSAGAAVAWGGGLLMVVGGFLVAMTRRRRRSGERAG
jgi:hypothetical protein